MIELETVPAKALLRPCHTDERDFFACDDILNLYHGCNHGCIYCDSRSECYHLENFDRLRVKQDCLRMLDDELKRRKKAGIVNMGATSDSYNALEEKAQVTRGALQLLCRYGFGVGIPTKGGKLVTRDIDLLQKIARQAPVRVSFSISAADDALAKKLEPGAPPPSERFAALKALSDAGIFAGVWLNPVVPFITDTDENFKAAIEMTKAAGGRFVICFYAMTLRTGNREYFYQALGRDPALAPLRQRYTEAFGLDYECPSPRSEALYRLLTAECDRLGLHSTFADTNREMRSRAPSQLSLF